MKLLSLEIRNFRVIKSAQLVIPEKVIGIIGPNGAGKSTIIEAISYALYGNQTIRSGKDEIKSIFANPDENCQVSLEFLINNEKYKVIRRLVGKTERAEVELFRGDSSESVGVNETRSYVGQLLGLDWRGFLSSFLARQSELSALSDLQPSKRQDHIAGMLGIEKLDKAIKRVKDDTRLNRDKVTFLERHLGEKETVENRVNELTNDLTTMKIPLRAKEEEYKKIVAAHKELTDIHRKMSVRKDEFQILSSSEKAEQQTLVNLKEQKYILIQEKEELIQFKKNIEKLEKELIVLPEIRIEIEKLIDRKNKFSIREQLLSQKESIDEDMDLINNRLNFKNKEIEQLDKQKKEYPADIENKLNDEKKKLETARNNYTQIKAEFNTIGNEKEKLTNQLNSINDLGPDSVCDHCLRPLGDDFNEINEHFRNELARIENDLSNKYNSLEKIKKEGEVLRKFVEQLEGNSKKLYQLNLSFTAVQKELASMSDQFERNRLRLSEIKKELVKYLDITYDSSRYEQLIKELTALEEKQKEYNQLTGRIVRLNEVDSLLKDYDRKIITTEASMKDIKLSLEQLDFNKADFEKQTGDFQVSQNKLEAVKDEYLTLQKEMELLEKELNLKIEQLSGFKQKMVELEDVKGAHYYGEKLSNLFGDYKRDLIASIRPSLADLSSRLFNEMTDNKYSLVELDEKYNLRVMDGGTFYGVDRFSGGEKDLANLCLRLAISLSLTESAGLDRSFVILDEVFGSQDNERKELILNALAKLKNRFPQILLITHIEDIKDGVEQIIEVKPTGYGWSEVFVDENR